jgi:hypothetical protein
LVSITKRSGAVQFGVVSSQINECGATKPAMSWLMIPLGFGFLIFEEARKLVARHCWSRRQPPGERLKR